MKISAATAGAVARATLSLLVYTRVNCPACDRLVISFPGIWHVEVYEIDNPSGRGAITSCQRCRTKLEVIPHG